MDYEWKICAKQEKTPKTLMEYQTHRCQTIDDEAKDVNQNDSKAKIGLSLETWQTFHCKPIDFWVKLSVRQTVQLVTWFDVAYLFSTKSHLPTSELTACAMKLFR